MVQLSELSALGFGAYRISSELKEHYEALTWALTQGCNLIDTSSNYTDGQSETLIGKVLHDRPEFAPFIVTKAGYIQGKNLKVLPELLKKGLPSNEVVDMEESLKHSIHPLFLQNQLNTSLKRLGVKKINGFLLHNPEYFFKKYEGDQGQEEYYSRIKRAFEFLEEKVCEGVIDYYGISSNHFVLPADHLEVTHLGRVFEIAKSVSSQAHFKLIQFPYNLMEQGAYQNQYAPGKNLFQLAKEQAITTFINRPLNAIGPLGLTRLATYDDQHQELAPQDVEDIFNICMDLIEKKWNQAGVPKKFGEIKLMNQFREVWRDFYSTDSVQQVFHNYFFPFISQLWGGKIGPKEAKPFVLLYETGLSLARQRISAEAHKLDRDWQDQGILPRDSRPLAVRLCEKYLQDGAQHVLVGMRSKAYVDQLKEFF